MNIKIELFRAISAFGIVWYHSGIKTGKEIAYSGLIFFTVVSVYFATKSTRSHSLFERVKRLIIPCLIWSVFYGVIEYLIHGNIYPKGYNIFSVVLATPSIHLWFLPFIFFCLVFIDRFYAAIQKEWVSTLLGIGAFLLIALSPFWRELRYIPPLGQYAHAMPAVFIGMFLGRYNEVSIRRTLLTGIVLSILIMVLKQQPGIGIPYLFGLVPCYFLIKGSVTNNTNKYIIHISSATLGIYLIHPFILIVLTHLGMGGYWLPMAAFLLSLFSILVFKAYFPKKIVKFVV